MIIKVDKHQLKILEEEKINEKELNIQEIKFVFSDDYKDFNKSFLVTNSNFITKKYIIPPNNKISMPFFDAEGKYLFGVFAEKVIDNKIFRLNPSPIAKRIIDGSFKEAENHEEITASEFEQYISILNKSIENIPFFIKDELEKLNLDDFYVKKQDGKGLSTNDFTNEEKRKLDSLNNYNDAEIRREIENLSDEIKNISLVPGPQGPPGENGVDGQDGYTPQRGTDYWTGTDIEDIKRYCSDYIDDNYLSLLGGSY